MTNLPDILPGYTVGAFVLNHTKAEYLATLSIDLSETRQVRKNSKEFLRFVDYRPITH